MTLTVFQGKGQILAKCLYSHTCRGKKGKNFKIQKGQLEFVIRIRTHCNGQKYKKTNNIRHYTT